MTKGPNDPLAGVLWMLATGLNFVAVTAIIRYLGPGLPAAEGAFIRFCFGLAFLMPALVPVLRAGLPRGTFRLFAARGALHSIATALWFYAMARLPVAEVTAIGYLNPVVVTIGAAVVFGERLHARRIVAVAVALVGALIILRPGLRELSSGHLAQLGAAFFFGVSYLIAKELARHAPAGAIVAIMSLSVTIGLAPLAALDWVAPSATQLAWLALVAVFATGGHYCMSRAFAAAPLTVTQPVVFLQLVWATILGAAVFAEPVDPWVLIGGAVIIGAISYITWREARLRKVGNTPAAVD